jgi:hypothetical protein
MQVVIILALVGACLALPPAHLHVEPSDSRPVDFVCGKEGVMVPNTHALQGFRKCKAEYGPESGKNPNCKYFCEAKVLNLLDKTTGLPTEELYNTWVERNLLKSQETLAKAHFKDCITKYGKKWNL